ncbi:hypothetical protein [Haloterrigena salifodinae]|uniref:hypothetical protein n=1 Tax=Haloterrigena salifodinae TaxID=2675099 RepID=UPI000F8978E0|nr:hypothetical protein [Haloterrigena salifodinae]
MIGARAISLSGQRRTVARVGVSVLASDTAETPDAPLEATVETVATGKSGSFARTLVTLR